MINLYMLSVSIHGLKFSHEHHHDFVLLILQVDNNDIHPYSMVEHNRYFCIRLFD